MHGTRPHARDLRKGRHSRHGNFYFLTTCVEHRRPIFHDPGKARIVLDAIAWLSEENRFVSDAAVVMPDHLHLVGQLRALTLEEIMRVFKGFTAHRLSAAGVATPVWQAGFHDHGLRRNEDYRTMIKYVLQNPVRAGLAERVEDYPFSIFPEWWKAPIDYL